MSNARSFLAKVLPWSDTTAAFFNIHWKSVTSEGKTFWGGRASKTLDEMERTLGWAKRQTDIKDLYVCMSSQSKCDEKVSAKGFGYRNAIRFAQNAVELKSLFIDVDVKADAYKDQEQALDAFKKFLDDSGMPMPSVSVETGSGGFHAHWVLEEALAPAPWQVLANALAFITKHFGLITDAGCTVDSARILRIPDTFNHKHTPPTDVKLLSLGVDYPVGKIEEILKPYMGREAPSINQDFPLERRPPTTEGSELSAGIVHDTITPKISDVAKICGFVETALKTGGESYNNPQWFMTSAIASFCEDGRAVAHKMGNRHPGYTEESTDKQYDRLVESHKLRNVGWPQCEKIQISGSVACAPCPLFKQKKSPLNFAAAVAQPPKDLTPAEANTLLPDHYHRDAAGFISRSSVDDNGVVTSTKICDYTITDGWLQDKPTWLLHFSTTTAVGKTANISIPLEEFRTVDGGSKILATHGLVQNDKMSKLTKEFFMAWIQKLQKTRNQVVSATPYGWSIINGKIEGFAYGGRVWCGVSDRPASQSEHALGDVYAPHGELSVWLEAARLTDRQNRPALNAIIAASFGAPLIKFCGKEGVIFCVYSTESGIGKTTAMRTAAAIWGHPKRATQTINDTDNRLFNKMGKLQHLPLFWDEVRPGPQMEKLGDMIYRVVQGVEKDRLNAQLEGQNRGTWNTMMLTSCNSTLVDIIQSRSKDNDAGLARILEAVVEPPDENTPGRIEIGTADRMDGKLEDNYGVAGLVYAKFLGANFGRIDREAGVIQNIIHKEVKSEPAERLWVATITAILLGARYANELQLTNIDTKELKAFLYKTFERMRYTVRGSSVSLKNKESVSNVLGHYINAMSQRHTLRTNRIHRTAGKPPRGSVSILNDVSRLDGIYVHHGVDDNVVRISKSHLTRWLRDHDYAENSFIEALKEKFKADVDTAGRIASGTDHVLVKERLIELNMNLPELHGFVE